MNWSRIVVFFLALIALSAAVAAGTAIAFSQSGNPSSESSAVAPSSPTSTPPPGAVKTGPKEKPSPAKAQAWIGIISDSVCGGKHTRIPGANGAECARGCVAKGTPYALVVGSNLYTLQGGPEDKLNALTGSRAKITGTLNGDTIQVASVLGASRKTQTSN